MHYNPRTGNWKAYGPLHSFYRTIIVCGTFDDWLTVNTRRTSIACASRSTICPEIVDRSSFCVHGTVYNMI